MESLLSLAVALVVVFVAAQVFTNALEYLGEAMGVSEGVTGSIFAAIGTAMPETIVPLVAILAGGASEAVNHEVGMGAILGAPFMLATLSIGLMGLFAGLRHGWSVELHPEFTGMKRDTATFFIGYGLVIVAALLPASWASLKVLIALSLFVVYFLYLMKTIRASQVLVENGHAMEADEALYFGRLLGESMPVAFGQLLAGLALLVWGAKLFVHGVETASEMLGVSALVVSLLIVPIATELPEKVNSILWIRKRRDTLAFGNISGAMVFQGTVIPATGIMLIDWRLNDPSAAMAVILALAGNAWLWYLRRANKLNPFRLLGGILLYGLFGLFVIMI